MEFVPFQKPKPQELAIIKWKIIGNFIEKVPNQRNSQNVALLRFEIWKQQFLKDLSAIKVKGILIFFK